MEITIDSVTQITLAIYFFILGILSFSMGMFFHSYFYRAKKGK